MKGMILRKNNFKEELKFNSRRNIDEMIGVLFFNEVKKLCKELEKQKINKNLIKNINI